MTRRATTRRALTRRALTRRAREDGSATILVLAASTFALAVAVAIGLLGAGLRAGARARTAADLAALAASDALARGGLASDGLAPEAPCDQAAAVAVRNAARLVSCTPDTTGVSVVVETRFLVHTVRASARGEPGAVVTDAAPARATRSARVARAPPG